MPTLRSFIILILVALALGLIACERPKAQQRLTLTGSSTIAPLALELGKRFEAQHPGVRVEVQTGGSSRGVADARQGKADLGMVSRALKPSEQDIKAFTIARDGIALIVHKDNPLKGLTREQVIQIYTKRVTRWSQLDPSGADAPITVVNKAEGRSTLELFVHHFSPELTTSTIKADVVIGDNQQGIKSVAGDVNAIGYVSIGTAQYDVEHGVGIKLISVDGQQPSLEAVASGELALSRPLNLVSKPEPSPLAKQFIDFAQGAAVHDLVKSQYFVPISP